MTYVFSRRTGNCYRTHGLVLNTYYSRYARRWHVMNPNVIPF